MKITIKYNPIYEYRRLYFNLHKIANGWFQDRGFTVGYSTDRFVDNGEPLKEDKAALIIPDWKLLHQRSFWNEIETKATQNKNYIFINKDFVPALYKEVCNEKPIEISEIEKNWQKVNQKFIKTYEEFVDCEENIIEAKVYITKYGTKATYNQRHKEVRIYLREDGTVSDIGWCILAGLLHKKFGICDYDKNGEFTWAEKQKTIDYLMMQTAFKEIFPNFQSLVTMLRNTEYNIALLDRSNQIYEKLGYPSKSSLQVVDQNVYWNDEAIYGFTKSERQVLRILNEKKGDLVTYDEISEALWGDQSYAEFSLEAINKIIERIRKKFIEHGIFKQFIYTRRGLGYVMAW